VAESEDLDRLAAFTYLTVPECEVFLAIMRLFTGSLMADLSAQQVSAAVVGLISGGLGALADDVARPGGIDPAAARESVAAIFARWDDNRRSVHPS
jgi:hypothetical protein